MRKTLCALLMVLLTGWAIADGPKDNIADNVRPVPPPGNPIPPEDRKELEEAVAGMGREIAKLSDELKDKPELAKLLPDVRIHHDAVRFPLVYNELLDVKNARAAIQEGNERIRQLRAGKAEWIGKSGARGYVSKIDGSVQPYLLYVPAVYSAEPTKPRRLDFFCHGRGENLMHLPFIRGKADGSSGDKFMVTLYGRYCCANKFAGEIDALEALEDMKSRYPIDENRVVMTGFSMGGAAAWQFAVHYSDLWCATQPGAGFSETADFLKVFQKETVKPTDYEQKLWHWYDCTDYAANLFNVPTIAYSGEVDSQRQAAEMMEKALTAEGMKLEHIIGPKMGHQMDAGSRKIINQRLDEIAEKGRNTAPKKIRFTTWTLRYNRMFWVTVEGMDEHWKRARVEAEVSDPATITVKTENVSELLLTYPLPKGEAGTFVIDGQKVASPVGLAERFQKVGGKWQPLAARGPQELRKKHGSQGPIDDAFMDSFIIVKPTEKGMNEKIDAWAKGECEHAILHWYKQFRGEARVKNDTEVTEQDIASANLVLFGDPSSNALMAKIAGKLPIQWTKDGVMVGEKKFDPATCAPVMIYPNPLNPNKYVVINSGFTFREYDYLNNARQVPKLPDWAVIDTTTPVGSRAPGKVAGAGFFDESWQIKGGNR